MGYLIDHITKWWEGHWCMYPGSVIQIVGLTVELGEYTNND